MYSWMHAYDHVCTYVRMHVCMYAYMYVVVVFGRLRLYPLLLLRNASVGSFSYGQRPAQCISFLLHADAANLVRFERDCAANGLRRYSPDQHRSWSRELSSRILTVHLAQHAERKVLRAQIPTCCIIN